VKRATWLRIREVFERAIELPRAQREDFLARECGGEADVRAEVQRMLDSDEGATGFLEQASVLEAALLPAAGTRIGRYTLRRVLASGGMGTVFEAVQDEPRRTVALKTLRLGLGSPERVQRFRFEAEVLGNLRHRSIAQIFEAGTHEQAGEVVPFFAMELVTGARDLLTYAQEEGLSLAQRLRLFLEVCEAVQHGHQKGVIHRDLKPGNVLVDAEGAVKVIDFGVARMSGPETAGLRERATQTGQILGTLAYMAPEQLAGDPAALDVRSDVYALGILLFELVEERPPHELEGKTPAEALLAIREAAPRPSASTSRELGWVLGKALAKEPERRYGSASELAADVTRFLEHEPVLAGPPSVGYRVAKLLRRHRLFLASAAAVIVALSIGLVRSERSARAATRAREDAEGLALAEKGARADAQREAHKAAVVNDFLERMLRSVDPMMKGRDALVLDVLEEASRALERGELDDPEVLATAHKIVATSYDNLGLYDRAEVHLLAARSLVERLPAENPVSIAVLSSFAEHLQLAERNAEAEPLARELLPFAERVLGPDHEETSNIRQNLAVCLRNQGSVAEAEDLLVRELDLLHARFGRDDERLIEPTLALATVQHSRGAVDESLRHFEEAERLCETLLGQGDFRARRVRLDHATALLAVRGSTESAEIARETFDWARRELGPRHRITLTAMITLATALTHIGREARDEAALEETRVLLEEYCGHVRAVYGSRNLLLLSGLTLYAVVLEELGAPWEAETAARDAVAVAQAFLPPDHRAGLVARTALGRALVAQERFDEAEEIFLPVLRELERQFPPADSRRMEVLPLLARVQVELGRNVEAIATGEELLRLDPESPESSEVRDLIDRARAALALAGG
jgi:tetratricopeptide (TPR) repeat protein